MSEKENEQQNEQHLKAHRMYTPTPSSGPQVSVTTPRDVDGIQLSVTITGRDVQEQGVKAITEAINSLSRQLAIQILTKAMTRAL